MSQQLRHITGHNIQKQNNSQQHRHQSPHHSRRDAHACKKKPNTCKPIQRQNPSTPRRTRRWPTHRSDEDKKSNTKKHHRYSKKQSANPKRSVHPALQCHFCHSAESYYQSSPSSHFLHSIKLPTRLALPSSLTTHSRTIHG